MELRFSYSRRVLKTITVKHQQVPQVDSDQLSYSIELVDELVTTRELIVRSVREHIRMLRGAGHFERGLMNRTLSRLYLSESEIEEMVKSGKISLPVASDDCDSRSFVTLAEEKAIQAFSTGRLAILVKGRQLESLEEELTFADQVKVIFIRLVPLQGG